MRIRTIILGATVALASPACLELDSGLNLDGGGTPPGAAPADGAAASLDPGTAVGAGCPTNVFADLSDVEGAGPAYPKPSVQVTCSADAMTVKSNGIPHYEFQQVTPNALSAQGHSWTVPLNPQVAGAITDIPLLGVVAFSINGISIYGPNEGAFPDPYGDPVYNDMLDWCLGHTAQAGDYHYHALLEACLAVVQQGAASPILGYALDGFPIYGPRACVDAACTQVSTFESSWEQVGDPTTYAWDNHQCTAATCAQAAGTKLDRCNGRVGPDGTYRYHATGTFPYVIGCYRGTPSTGGGAQGGAGGQAPQGGQQAGGPGGAGAPPSDGGQGSRGGAGQQPPADGQGMGRGGQQPPARRTGQPATCSVDADCAGKCPPDAIGCGCDDSPMGLICVPLCETAADCPPGPGGAMTCDAQRSICVPPAGR